MPLAKQWSLLAGGRQDDAYRSGNSERLGPTETREAPGRTYRRLGVRSMRFRVSQNEDVSLTVELGDGLHC
jgi:hypothetical protein